jgi:tRNA pseudouridine38-40 synthase
VHPWPSSNWSDRRLVVRIRGLLAYDGSAFHGWARQDGLATLQGTVEEAFATACNASVDLVVAGRTDAGVHAWGQVISGDVPADTDLGLLRQSVNAITPRSISMRSLDAAAEDFSARFSASARTYVYRLNTADHPDPFRHSFEWWVRAPLDVPAMTGAAICLEGEHDFAAFCKATSAGGTIRRVTSVRVTENPPDRVEVWMTATSFCHQMVRSVVGILEAVGHGRRGAPDVGKVLESRDRSANSSVAPPQGLTLWSVSYPDTQDAT